MTVRVGVIGTGAIGADHVDRLTTQVVGSTVTAVFDVATDRARDVAAASGAVVHASWEALVAADDVDAVVVASPGELHPEQVLACLHAGKPVLCEKPLAMTTTEAVTVLEAETAAGRRLVQVGFMRRFDAGYRDVRAAMSSGAIGEPLLAHAVHRNASVPDFFRGEMALTESAVHEFDVFRWLFGAEVAAVTVVPVRSSPLAANGLRDPQVVVLELAGGEVVTVESFVNCRYGYDVRCEVVGSLGTVSLDNPRTTVVLGAAGRSERVPADWRERFADAYRAELQAWVDALRRGTFTGASAWDGYVATAVGAAAVRSFREGRRTTVDLVARPALYA
jgi:myo-inositol 2-dehydrogenase/D-chiro-inositol 1-dehydrogenase